MKNALNRMRKSVAFALAVLMLVSSAYGCWGNRILVRAESEGTEQNIEDTAEQKDKADPTAETAQETMVDSQDEEAVPPVQEPPAQHQVKFISEGEGYTYQVGEDVTVTETAVTVDEESCLQQEQIPAVIQNNEADIQKGWKIWKDAEVAADPSIIENPDTPIYTQEEILAMPIQQDMVCCAVVETAQQDEVQEESMQTETTQAETTSKKKSAKIMSAASTAVCRIGSTTYTSLQDAEAAVGKGTSATIEMLVSKYEVSSTIHKTNNADITLTTSSTVGGNCVITKSAGFTGSLLQHNMGVGGTTTLQHITLDGAGSTIAYLVSGSLVLGTGGVLQNASHAVNMYMSSSFSMQDGIIQNVIGRAVYCDYSSTSFKMSGGVIKECVAEGTETADSIIGLRKGSFTMTGGIIQNNCVISSANYAAIVCSIQGGSISLQGGEISGNYISSPGGAGVTNLVSSSSINIGGSLILQDNYGDCSIDKSTHQVTVKGTQCNLALREGKQFQVTNAVSTAARIGVTFVDAAYMTVGAQIGSTSAADASTVSGLTQIVADTNTGDATDLQAVSGAGNAVVWGKIGARINCLVTRNGKEIEYNAESADTLPRAGETVTIRSQIFSSDSAAHKISFSVPKLQLGGSNVAAKENSLKAYAVVAGTNQSVTVGSTDIFNGTSSTTLSIPANADVCYVEYQVEIPQTVAEKITLESSSVVTENGHTTTVDLAANIALCKIGEVGYMALSDALAAVVAGTPATIEMLVKSDELPAKQSIPTGKSVTITTAGTLAKPCVLKKSTGCTGIMLESAGTLILNNIAVDGTQPDGSIVSSNCLINVTQGTLEIGDGATIQNNNADRNNGAGIQLANNTTGELKEGGLIQNCISQRGSAVYVTGTNGVFTMSGGSITNCVSQKSTLNYASVVDVEYATFNMSGGKIYKNYNLSTMNATAAVCIEMTGKCNLTGGEISENYATCVEGAGIRNRHNNETIGIGKDIVIKNNYGGCTIDATDLTNCKVTTKGAQRNLLLTRNVKCTIQEAFSETAQIGISSLVSTNIALGLPVGTTIAATAADVANLDHIIADTNSNPNTLNLQAEAGTGNTVVWGVKSINDISYLVSRNGKETECIAGNAETCPKPGETVTVRTKLASFTESVAAYDIAFRVSKLQLNGENVDIKKDSLTVYTEENGAKQTMTLDHKDIFNGTTTVTLTMPEKVGAVYVEYQVEIPYTLSGGCKLDNECTIQVGTMEVKASKAVNIAVCKIGEKGYETLADAIAAVDAATPATIEMLMESCELSKKQSIPSGKTVTITTAGTLAKPCVLKKSTGCTGIMLESAGNLTLKNITIDGIKQDGTMNSAACLLYVSAGTLELGNQTTIQNNDATTYCGGVNIIGSTTKAEMKEGCLIQNCYGTCGGALLCQTTGCEFIMSGGMIQNCAGKNGNSTYTSAVDVERATFQMTGGTIKHNYSFSTAANASIFCVEKTGTAILTGGEISENYAVSAGGAGVRNLASNGSIQVGHNMVIQDNYKGCTIDPVTFQVTSKGELSNLALAAGLKLKIISPLTMNAKIGLTNESSGGMGVGASIGTTTSTAADVANLDHIMADTNTGNQQVDLFGAAGTGNEVVWDVNVPIDFSFTKVDAADNTKTLSDVEFKLYELNSAKADEVVKDKNAVVSEDTIADGAWTAVTNTATSSECFVSDANGLVQMSGLKNGYYMLVEIKCQSGYQLPKGQWLLEVHNKEAEPVSITAHGGGMPPAFYSEVDNATNKTIYYLPNTRTFALPLSGFGGMKTFLIIGGGIMLAALLLLGYKRKKDRRLERIRQELVFKITDRGVKR